MADKDSMERDVFANRMKPLFPHMQSQLGEFATYLLENVAACKQSGGSDLLSKKDATEIMAYVQELSSKTGGAEADKMPLNIREALPELMELRSIVATIKNAMATDSKVDKELIKRYFMLSARAINYVQFTLDDTGV